MSPLLIRPAHSADLKRLVELTLHVELFRNYGMTESSALSLFETALSDPESDVAVVAFAAKEADSGIPGKVLGFAWFLRKGAFGRSAYLRLIAVDPAARGTGAGRKLLEHFEGKYLAPHGIFLLVTHTNDSAQGFYERSGYSRVGEIPDFIQKGMNERIYFKPAAD
ncbi:MAG: GNAT family N-acetyltransferase [Methylotenera sp.]|nr:GNAT family N-acetyltransferase [Oligoflexia bacterium]